MSSSTSYRVNIFKKRQNIFWLDRKEILGSLPEWCRRLALPLHNDYVKKVEYRQSGTLDDKIWR